MNYFIDLILWNNSSRNQVNWTLGNIHRFPSNLDAAGKAFKKWASQSNAEFGLFWTDESTLPSELILKSLIETKLDIAHAGLSEGMDDYWPSLAMIKQDCIRSKTKLQISSFK